MRALLLILIPAYSYAATPSPTPTVTPTLTVCELYRQRECCTYPDRDTRKICTELNVEYKECCSREIIGENTGSTGVGGAAGSSGGSSGSFGNEETYGSSGVSSSGENGSGGSSGWGGSSGRSGTSGTNGSGGSSGGEESGSSGTEGGGEGGRGVVRPCNGYNNDFLKATLTIPNKDQYPSGILFGDIEVKGCACIDRGAIGCEGCGENALEGECGRANQNIISSLDSFIKGKLIDEVARKELAVSNLERSEGLSRIFRVRWDTSGIQRKDFVVRGKLESQTNRALFTDNTVSVSVANSGGDKPPVAECRDHVEIKFYGWDGKEYPDGTWSVCFDTKSGMLYPKSCKDGQCSAWRRPPTDQEFHDIFSEEEPYLSPAKSLCHTMGGALRDIKFNWQVDGVLTPYSINQCYFQVEDDPFVQGSFFSVDPYYHYQLDRYATRNNLQDLAGEAIMPGVETQPPCSEGDPTCDLPNVCKKGSNPVRCYFNQPDENCIGQDERIDNCQMVDNFNSVSAGVGETLHAFTDRSYPSGSEVPASCWAAVRVICAGQPDHALDSYFGNKEPTPICKQGMLMGDRRVCSECKTACMNDCMDSEVGPCSLPYFGYAEGCGACQYNCDKTYENCMGA